MFRRVGAGSRALCAFGVALVLVAALFVVVRVVAAEPGAGLSSSGPELPVTNAITATVRRDIVLLLDNSRSMVEEFDPDDKRSGFARFLVRLLQTFAREGSSVGAIRFAAAVSNTLPTGVESLVALSPVSEWSRGDFLAVKAGKCPQPGQAEYRTPGRDPCFGTRFAAALREAGAALRGCATAGPASQCAILMFTDGDLSDPGDVVDSPEEIARALRDLPPGVKVYIVFFGKEDAVEPESSKAWKAWREPNGRINDWFFNAATAERKKVYDAALGMLGMESLSAGLPSVDLPALAEVAVNNLPPNVDRLELDLLPDVEVTETFTASWDVSPADRSVAVRVEPDVNEGARRIWLSPSFDRLTMSLVGAEGVAYYRVVTRTVPVQAWVTVWPTEVAVGQPVQVQALVSAGGRVLSDSSKISVIPIVWPDGKVLPALHIKSEGVWAGTLEMPASGQYSLTVDVRQNGRSFLSSELIVSPGTLAVSKVRVAAQTRVWPETQWVGRPVQLEAILLSNGSLVNTLPPNSSPTIVIQPSGMRYGLNPRDDGTWRADEPIRISIPDSYKASVEVPGWDSVEARPAFFTILSAPELRMEVSPLRATPGDEVQVRLWVSSTDVFTPTLLQLIETDWIQVTLDRLVDNQYGKRMQMPATGDLILAASLPEFPEQEPQMVIVRQIPASSGWRETVLRHVPRVGIPAVLLSLIILVVWLVFKRQKARRPNVLIAEIVKNPSRWDQLRDLSVEENWEMVKALASYIRDYERGVERQKDE